MGSARVSVCIVGLLALVGATLTALSPPGADAQAESGPRVSFASAGAHHHEHVGGGHDHNHNPHSHNGNANHEPHEHDGSGMHTHGHPRFDHQYTSVQGSYPGGSVFPYLTFSHEHGGTRHSHDYQDHVDRRNGNLFPARHPRRCSYTGGVGLCHSSGFTHTHTHTSSQIAGHSHPRSGSNWAQVFNDRSNRISPMIEHRLSQYNIQINLDSAPTADLRLVFRYSGNAEWFKRTNSPVVTDYLSDRRGNVVPLYKYVPWTGDYYLAYDGTEDRCSEPAWGPNRRQRNCAQYSRSNRGGNDRTSGYLTTTIPAGTTQHTMKMFVWDDDIHDSGETVTLTLQPHERVAGGAPYRLGSRTTHTVTIVNDEPPPPVEEAAPADPTEPDLDAPAPAAAEANVRWNGDLLVGWPDYAGASKVHVRARSANGHGTEWGYNQSGNWFVFEGLKPGTWIVEILKTDFATKLSGWVVVQMPKADALPDAPTPVAKPTVRVTAGSAVSEGDAAKFTVSASPAPASPLTVQIDVSQNGDYAARGSTGAKTVTIPVSGAAVLNVPTLDDKVDEADGSVSVTISSDNGYKTGTPASAAVPVADDDDPPQPAQPETPEPAQPEPETPEPEQPDPEPETPQPQTPEPAQPKTPEPAPTPEVTVSGGAAVTEGGAATFTVSATPSPSSPLTVSVSVSASGDYAASGATGTKSVTIPVSGSVSYSVPTVDDTADEADGSVTVQLSSGQGYTVGTSSSATVAVSDNDDPPPACPATNAALVTQLEAKVVRHRDVTGRADLFEMFSRSLATMKGNDTYTTAAIKARPDKQGANWQGAGSNPLWQAVYAELDRLETCRTS